MIWIYIFIFIMSFFALALSGKWMVKALTNIAKILGWREFVVAFIIVSLGTSIPNLFVGISSALHKIPELSFGDVVGGNLVDLTLLVAITTFIAGGFSVESRLVQKFSIFTISAAVLPLILVLDGKLSRPDGIILLFSFFFYIRWLFQKEERFTKVYDHATNDEEEAPKSFKKLFKEIAALLGGLTLLLISSEAIVRLSSLFAAHFNASVAFIGFLIVGLGNALPELFFSISSAKSGQTWMVLGSLMGSVVIISTLVLGIVALIYPIQITDLSPFAVARFFLLISALFFLVFIRTDRKITAKEAIFLLFLYVSFVIAEILIK